MSVIVVFLTDQKMQRKKWKEKQKRKAWQAGVFSEGVEGNEDGTHREDDEIALLSILVPVDSLQEFVVVVVVVDVDVVVILVVVLVLVVIDVVSLF